MHLKGNGQVPREDIVNRLVEELPLPNKRFVLWLCASQAGWPLFEGYPDRRPPIAG
jgi:hypothetical protein